MNNNDRNKSFRHYLDKRPRFGFALYGVLAMFYVALATYGFAVGQMLLVVAATIAMIAMLIEANRRRRNFRLG